MTVFQYKITALVEDNITMIINLFTPKDMDNVFEKERYVDDLLEHGVVPADIKFEKLNEYDSTTPFFKPACEGIMYALENPS